MRRLRALGVPMGPGELDREIRAALAVARATSPHYVMLYIKTALNSWPTSARLHPTTGVEPCVWGCADGPDSLGHYLTQCRLWQATERRLGLPPSGGVSERLALVGGGSRSERAD